MDLKWDRPKPSWTYREGASKSVGLNIGTGPKNTGLGDTMRHRCNKHRVGQRGETHKGRKRGSETRGKVKWPKNKTGNS